MVNIFTKKNKHKTDIAAEDSHTRLQDSPLSSSAFSSRKVALGKQNPKEVDELPQLRDYPASKREVLFDQKLELCSQVFNFEDVLACPPLLSVF
jgi:serine/threonine-protein phosphatase 2A regulatory subunit B'